MKMTLEMRAAQRSARSKGWVEVFDVFIQSLFCLTIPPGEERREEPSDQVGRFILPT
jgi:hypothetical protein